jgi:hypothetical protein
VLGFFRDLSINNSTLHRLEVEKKELEILILKKQLGEEYFTKRSTTISTLDNQIDRLEVLGEQKSTSWKSIIKRGI